MRLLKIALLALAALAMLTFYLGYRVLAAMLGVIALIVGCLLLAMWFVERRKRRRTIARPSVVLPPHLDVCREDRAPTHHRPF